ncbi:MAG: rhomboid family intramembrane serine protease [Chitinophagaceae bacterium]|nr:rhomboid family intramembrane serine protease [Chitinophagaceae bacterium]
MFSITLTIVIVTAIISFTAFNNEKIKDDLLFWPAEIRSGNQWYRFITCGFVHGDLLHLAFNMLSLYSLGLVTEGDLFSSPALFGSNGKIAYLILYLTALIASVIPDYIYHKDNVGYRALGASGAVSAVIFAFIILQPARRLSILFLPIPGGVPAYVYGLVFLGISIYLSRKGNDNIGHRAHISGAVYGILFTIVAARIFAGFDVLRNFVENVF